MAAECLSPGFSHRAAERASLTPQRARSRCDGWGPGGEPPIARSATPYRVRAAQPAPAVVTRTHGGAVVTRTHGGAAAAAAAGAGGECAVVRADGDGPVRPTELRVRPTELRVRPTELRVRPTELRVRPTELRVRPTELRERPT
eukprot:gene32776-6244_t